MNRIITGVVAAIAGVVVALGVSVFTVSALVSNSTDTDLNRFGADQGFVSGYVDYGSRETPQQD